MSLDISLTQPPQPTTSVGAQVAYTLRACHAGDTLPSEGYRLILNSSSLATPDFALQSATFRGAALQSLDARNTEIAIPAFPANTCGDIVIAGKWSAANTALGNIGIQPRGTPETTADTNTGNNAIQFQARFAVRSEPQQPTPPPHQVPALGSFGFLATAVLMALCVGLRGRDWSTR
jgi:hypothetical protein